MIYLIDDNQNKQRLLNYNITFIEDGVYAEYLTSIEKLEFVENYGDISHLEFLKTADCILLHSTTEDYDENKGFISGSKTNVLKIKELISEEGEKIPLVLFSNSMGEPEYQIQSDVRYISTIKKNLFYERLLYFLEHYKNTGKVELRIIAAGKNFASKEISRIVIEILNSVELKDNMDILKLHDLSSVLLDFKSFIKLSFPEKNINDFFSELEDNPMIIKDFKRNINQIAESFTRYGKNIYPWK